MRNRLFIFLLILRFIPGIAVLSAQFPWPAVNEMPVIETVTSPDDPDFPNLPDPLLFFDFENKTPWGDAVRDSLDWHERRREEIKSMLRRYMYGHEPGRPGDITFSLLSEDAGFLQGAATKKVIRGQVDVPGAREFILNVYVPNGLDYPAPVMMALSKEDADEIEPGGSRAHRWDIPGAIARGIAVAAARADHFASDGGSWRNALVQPYANASFSGDWETIAAWAWGTSRMVDYLVTDSDLDPNRLALTGFSRRGKSALWAGALDDRIELVIPHQSGSGGAAPNRPGWGNNSGFRTLFTHWYLDEFNQNDSEWHTLPFDQHFQLALIAPRKVLMSENSSSGPNFNGVLALQTAARPVWTFLGSDPGRVTIEWDDNSTHRFEPYHWAYMYDALLDLPLGGWAGFRQWAETEGLVTPSATTEDLRDAAAERDPSSGAAALEQYLFGSDPGGAASYRVGLVKEGDGSRRITLPHRRDAVGRPGRGSHWRGIHQWVEHAEHPNGPWIPFAVDELLPEAIGPGPTPQSDSLAFELQLPDTRYPLFFRLCYSIVGEDHPPQVNAPTVVEAEILSDTLTRVTFSEPVEAGTGSYGSENPVNYSFIPHVTVHAAELHDPQTVLIQTDALSLGGNYTLTVHPVNNLATPPVPSAEQQLLLQHLVVARINFQPASVQAPPGWRVDSGDLFGDRGNGFDYGWSYDPGPTRQRDHSASPDLLYDTLIHAGEADTTTDPDWEIALPNGNYDLRVVMGDAEYTGNTFRLAAQGTLFLSGTTSTTTRWIGHRGEVEVQNGRLTLSRAPEATRNKLNFLEIKITP